MEYYISRNDSKEGPFTIEELAEKRIAPDTLVWAVGYKEWRQAKNVPELESILYSTPPDPPAQQPMPKTWLVESILVTLFCCLPFGVVSIIYAVNAGSATDEAAKKLNTEKSVKWANYAVWIGIAWLVIVIVLNILLGVLGAAAA